MSLFPERQAAVKVLLEAAGQLLYDAARDDVGLNRQLCQIRSKECVELAEEIGKMGPIMIKPDRAAAFEVEDIPFSVGYVVRVNENA